MSPKIGAALDVRPYVSKSLRPLDLVRMAVAVVEAQGMRLALADQPDNPVSRQVVSGGWVSEGPYLPRRVTLLGAVCLVHQPMHGDTVEEGAVQALEVSWEWLHGLADGFEGEPQTTLLDGTRRGLYLDGVRAGHLLFAEVTIECEACGARRFRKDERCRGCP